MTSYGLVDEQIALMSAQRSEHHHPDPHRNDKGEPLDHSTISRAKATTFICHICVVLFAASTWINLNAVFVELPLVVHRLPERWGLASYLAVIAQCGNVGPLIFALVLERVCNRWVQANLHFIIAFMVTLSAVCTGLLAGLWHQTAVIGGTEHSLALFVLFFIISVIDCTSSVTYLPWMNTLRSDFILSYYIGTGISALVPSILSLIQGAGNVECVWHNGTNGTGKYWTNIGILENRDLMVVDNSNPNGYYEAVDVDPLFSTTVMLSVICVSVCISLLGFLLLGYSSIFKKEHIQSRRRDKKSSLAYMTFDYSMEVDDYMTQNRNPSLAVGSSHINGCAAINEDSSGRDVANDLPTGNSDANNCDSVTKPTSNSNHLHATNTMNIRNHLDSVNSITNRSHLTSLERCQFIWLVLLTGWICALMNGVITSVATYTSLPYGPQAYHLATCFSNLVNPVACFVPVFWKVRNVAVISLICAGMTVLAAFLMDAAVQSPHPVLVGTTGGTVMIIIVVTAFTGLCAFLRAVIAETLRAKYEGVGGLRALFWCGVATQGGSFVGAVVMFPIVNVYKLFTPAPSCPN